MTSRIGAEIVLPAHQRVELVERFGLLFPERNLLPVDRTIPAFGLLSEIGLTVQQGVVR